MNEDLARFRCAKPLCNFDGPKAEAVYHVVKEHAPLHTVPFYCTLCGYRCFRLKHLQTHVTKWHKHIRMTSGSHKDDVESLCRSSNPYEVTWGPVDDGKVDLIMYYPTMGQPVLPTNITTNIRQSRFDTTDNVSTNIPQNAYIPAGQSKYPGSSSTIYAAIPAPVAPIAALPPQPVPPVSYNPPTVYAGYVQSQSLPAVPAAVVSATGFGPSSSFSQGGNYTSGTASKYTDIPEYSQGLSSKDNTTTHRYDHAQKTETKSYQNFDERDRNKSTNQDRHDQSYDRDRRNNQSHDQSYDRDRGKNNQSHDQSYDRERGRNNQSHDQSYDRDRGRNTQSHDQSYDRDRGRNTQSQDQSYDRDRGRNTQSHDQSYDRDRGRNKQSLDERDRNRSGRLHDQTANNDRSYDTGVSREVTLYDKRDSGHNKSNDIGDNRAAQSYGADISRSNRSYDQSHGRDINVSNRSHDQSYVGDVNRSNRSHDQSYARVGNRSNKLDNKLDSRSDQSYNQGDSRSKHSIGTQNKQSLNRAGNSASLDRFSVNNSNPSGRQDDKRRSQGISDRSKTSDRQSSRTDSRRSGGSLNRAMDSKSSAPARNTSGTQNRDSRLNTNSNDRRNTASRPDENRRVSQNRSSQQRKDNSSGSRDKGGNQKKEDRPRGSGAREEDRKRGYGDKRDSQSKRNTSPDRKKPKRDSKPEDRDSGVEADKLEDLEEEIPSWLRCTPTDANFTKNMMMFKDTTLVYAAAGGRDLHVGLDCDEFHLVPGAILSQLTSEALQRIMHVTGHKTVYFIAGIPDLVTTLTSPNYEETIFEDRNLFDSFYAQMKTTENALKNYNCHVIFCTISPMSIRKYNEGNKKIGKTYTLRLEKDYDEMQESLHRLLKQLNHTIINSNTKQKLLTPLLHAQFVKRENNRTKYQLDLLLDGLNPCGTVVDGWRNSLNKTMQRNRVLMSKPDFTQKR